MSAPAFLQVHPDGVMLSAKVQPRSAKNEVGEPLGPELRIRVSAPPVDAAANKAAVELLAETLDCARNRVELVRGHTSRHKVFRLRGFTVDQVLTALGQ